MLGLGTGLNKPRSAFALSHTVAYIDSGALGAGTLDDAGDPFPTFADAITAINAAYAGVAVAVTFSFVQDPADTLNLDLLDAAISDITLDGADLATSTLETTDGTRGWTFTLECNLDTLDVRNASLSAPALVTVGGTGTVGTILANGTNGAAGSTGSTDDTSGANGADGTIGSLDGQDGAAPSGNATAGHGTVGGNGHAGRPVVLTDTVILTTQLTTDGGAGGVGGSGGDAYANGGNGGNAYNDGSTPANGGNGGDASTYTATGGNGADGGDGGDGGNITIGALTTTTGATITATNGAGGAAGSGGSASATSGTGGSSENGGTAGTTPGSNGTANAGSSAAAGASGSPGTITYLGTSPFTLTTEDGNALTTEDGDILTDET